MSFGHKDRPSGNAAARGIVVEQHPSPARLIVILPAALRAAWDRLGLLLAVSITWALTVSLPLSVERWLPRQASPILHLLALLLVPIAAALPTAGAFSIAHRIARHQEAIYAHLWQDGARVLGPALRLILVQTGVVVVLATAYGFYSGMSLWIGRAALILSGYAVLLWAMMLVYQWPALIAQENGQFDEPGHRAKRGAVAAVRRSFYLALGSPFFTLMLLAVLLLVSLLMAITLVLPALLWIGIIAIISTYATRSLLIQFGVVPAPRVQTPVADELFRLGEVKSDRRNRESEIIR